MSEVAMHTYRDESPVLGNDVSLSGSKDFNMSRSQEMRYVSITIPNELVNETVRALGEFGMFHVEDIVGANVTKHHFAYKKRTTDIGEVEKKLRNFEDAMKRLAIPVPYLDLNADLGSAGQEIIKNNPDVVVGASEFVNEFENQLNPNFGFEKGIQTEIARRVEMRAVLTEAPNLVPVGVHSSDAESAALNFDFSSQYSDEEAALGDGLANYICGMIPVQNQVLFSRMVHRISRGANAIVKFADPLPEPVIDPESGEPVLKAVFCIVTIGNQLNRRIRKLCPLVGASIYPVPSQPEVVASEAARLDSEIREQQEALSRTTLTITQLLESLAAPTEQVGGGFGPCPLRLWQQLLFRERVMIDALMKCEFHATLIYMAGWVPLGELENLAHVISDCGINGGASPAMDRNAIPPHGSTPPTYIEGNKFTSSFQGIVDTYGIPRYQEFNPGLFTIITFPFLFGVMYGDIGHGTIIGLCGILLILFEKTFDRMRKEGTMPEMLDMVYGGRYIIALMGIFGCYCGTIYNDFLSIPTNVHGTQWYIDPKISETQFQWTGHVYPWGVDPSWYHGKTSLKFFNSMKMKTAVIIGVLHMTFGIFLSLSNHLFFKDHVSIAFEFIPRILFMTCTFGYMIIMIFIKWCTDWTDNPTPPNLIQTMIDMFLSPGKVEDADLLYAHQGTVQLALLFIAVICIPWMLCAKPVVEYKKRQGGCAMLSWLHSPVDDEYRKAHALYDEDQHGDAPLHSVAVGGAEHDVQGEHEHHSFGDLMIHQGIHTIEFILGTVSNTASYLRLWALSLAHAQLSEVFWEKMIFEYGIQNSGIVGFAGTGVWVIATIGVIVAMDSLECFLHALRLHWVEFQNKFYYADGIAFKPFNFVPSSE